MRWALYVTLPPVWFDPGEVVGIIFDGNYESIASDWMFDPALTRSIHTDIRYVVWYLDRVAGEAALPERGPRWPLTYGEDGFTVAQPEHGRTLRFAPQPNAGIPGVQATVLPLKAIGDRNGNRIELEYGDDGDLTEVRHSGGYRVGVRTAGGRITEHGSHAELLARDGVYARLCRSQALTGSDTASAA